ncbi:MAG: protein translocase subunit SecF [Candidatus Woesearchaeota archaeon]
MSKKRLRREKAKLKSLKQKGAHETRKDAAESEGIGGHDAGGGRSGQGFLKRIKSIYEKDYKALMFITIILLLLAFLQIGYQWASTGDFINKGVSLKGGVTITIEGTGYDPVRIEDNLRKSFEEYDINVREMTSAGVQSGIIVNAGATENEDIRRMTSFLEDDLGIGDGDYSTEMIGSALGESFFRETITAILIAFVFMALVVFLYFRIPIPSIAVILAAISDIIITLAIVNLAGIKISTAGVAAFLMLVGYSVDTDILLSTRVLRRKEGTVMDGVYSAINTGLTMSVTTITAISVALIFAQSEVLKQIMMIVLIGLLVDILTTWIQNAGILRWYLEKRPEKGEIKS